APIVANIIMLGALLGTNKIPINIDEAEKEIKDSFPASKVELNLTALKMGLNGI
ncbi:MAG: indolepyruvate ferredoxin oxidoreductase, partial [Deltaproteobacteria bacterium]|nr:indolepyruvate ferredoxin oxidoreductase [Deltaproteobacteria bacterium]